MDVASESVVKGPSSSSSNAGDSYIGSFISLISKYEIRYEGVLYHLNIQDSTIGLKNVKSFGTEGRKKDGSQVPPTDKVYEYILFRGSDIKDLQVKSAPPAKEEEHIYSDPAIIQTQYMGVSSPPVSVSGKMSTESIQRLDTPIMTSRALPSLPPLHQYATQTGPSDQSSCAQVAAHPSVALPIYLQGYNGTSTSSSHPVKQTVPLNSMASVSSPLIMPNLMQAPETRIPCSMGLGNLSVPGMPVSSAPSSVTNPSSATLSLLQSSGSLNYQSPLPAKASVPYSASLTSNRADMSTSIFQDINSKSQAQVVGKIAPDPGFVFPGNSMHHSSTSFVDSASAPLMTPPSSLLTPDLLAQSRPPLFSSTQDMSPDLKDMGSVTGAFSSLSSTQTSQSPLLPTPVQQTSAQFTEEFDFEAMNEKFKKDEVWGSLGKVPEKVEVVEDNASAQRFGGREGNGLLPNPKPAYNKDEFFDTISCNSLNRGARNGQSRFTERMKQDSETFGSFQHRPNSGYSIHGARRGQPYRGSYNSGRGYGYGGRGRGGNTHF